MIVPSVDQTAPYAERLRDAYTDYVTNVSHPHHAVSLESAAMLWWYCNHVDARAVCDLGSGFSSYVLRQYAANADHDVFVSSIDTDPEWMQRTAEFIDGSGELLLWDDWMQSAAAYDVIFHDIAGGEFRESAMPVAADRLAEGGVLIFDDAHHPGHRAAMESACRERGWMLQSAHDTTVDEIGRYAMVATTKSRTLESEYRRLCETPSDIYLHLPRFVKLVEMTGAKHVIELGTRTGVSTIAWLYGLESTGGRLTSIDIDAKPDIDDHPSWTFIQGDDLAPAITSALEPADIVFIDTSHLYDQTVKELNVYRWLVKPGGLIVLHDTELEIPEGAPMRPRFPVKKAVVEFVEAEGYEWQNIPECWGLGIIQL